MFGLRLATLHLPVRTSPSARPPTVATAATSATAATAAIAAAGSVASVTKALDPLHPLPPSVSLPSYHWRSMLREALEDRKRHVDDKRVNSRDAKVP